MQVKIRRVAGLVFSPYGWCTPPVGRGVATANGLLVYPPRLAQLPFLF